MGGTMRLGADPVKLHDGTRAREAYGEPVIYQRHRHRYEVNNLLRRRLEDHGLVFSGTSPDDRLVEVDRAARPPVLHGLAVPPRVQVAPEPPRADVQGVRGRRARARARAGHGGASTPKSPAKSPRPSGPSAERAERGTGEPARGGSRAGGPIGWERRSYGCARSRARAAGGAGCRSTCDRELRGARPRRERGRHGRRDRRRLRQPARPDRRARGRSDGDVLRAPRHRPCRRPDRGRARGRGLPQPPRGDPRRRRQGRRGGDARACAPVRGRRRPGRRGAVFTTGEEVGLRGARAFDTSALARSSGTCSTTPRRSAAWWWPRRPTTACVRSSWAARRTPASGPRTGGARLPPPRARSGGCASGGSTTRRPRTWG